MRQSISIRVKLFCTALIILAVTAGCGGGGGGDSTPPTIANATATLPVDFSFDGGDVSITASVSDSGGVNEVHAVVTRPDGSNDPSPVTMTLNSEGLFAATYTATINTREDGEPETYTIVVSATDNAGNLGNSTAFQFQVPAPELPGDDEPF